jgi:uncharacterized membrane protein (DUF373 family)
MAHSSFDNVKKGAVGILYFLLLIILVAMLLGTAHLAVIMYDMVISPNPYVGVLNIDDLAVIFSMLLNIVVGYELLKSVHIIIRSDIIPVGSILKISGIAVANKIITMDFKAVAYTQLLGIAAIAVALGLAYYFFLKGGEGEQ